MSILPLLMAVAAMGSTAPETWFHVIGGNATAEGLTKDLEAIRAAGISGIQFFHGKFAGGRADVWEGMEDRQTPCLSPGWDRMVTHVADECRRLGLTFKMQNCPGWSMAGGPWITPEKAQRELVWSRTDFASDGGETELRLAAPPRTSEPWRDVKPVAVVAFPTPRDDIAGFVRPDRVEAPFFAPAFAGRAVALDPAPRDDPHVIAFAFARPTTIRTVELPAPSDFGQDWPYAIGMHVAVEAETAPGRWETLCDRDMPNGNWQDGAWTGSGTQSFAVSDAVARNWRIKLSAEHAGPLAYIRLRPGARLDNWESLAFTTLRNLVREKPALRQNASAWVQRADVVDLSGRTDAQGVFRGTLPAGRWTVLRFADVNAGLKNGPAPEEATGWECDKLDPQGIEANFAGYIGRLADGPLRGRLDGMLLDSWECARPNWTGKMERWFGERNGYPLRGWLPALAGFVIDDPAATERFLLDWRTTISTLIEENFFRRAVELGHAKGLSVQYETAFGDVMPGDLLRYWKWADEPMCEFWQPHTNRGYVGDLRTKPVRPCASAAHVYGKRRVSAEALTSFTLSWNENFRDFLHATVRHLLRGVTHLVFHTYTHNPLADEKRPGTSFGGAIGSPFLRGQTWWPWMPEFTGFLARCGRLLESGTIANEALQYLGDDLDGRPDELPQTLAGFGFDLLNRDALLERFRVEDGLFRTPEGAAWKVLWVPSGLYLRADTQAKLAELERAGGRVVRGTFAEFAAATADLRRDVVGEVDFLHRRDGGRDVFYVSGRDGAAFRGDVRFDARGPVRVYDPVADRSWAPEARAADGGTSVPLELTEDEAVFVIFNDGEAPPRRKFAAAGRELREWTVAFPRGGGCPKELRLTELKPLKDLDAPEEVAGFAGDVVYRTTFAAKAGERLRLSLGRVEAWAEVRVNGRTAARLWCAPYACDITGFTRDGENELEVVVTTTWLNRLVLEARGNGHSLGSWVKSGPNSGHPYVDSGLIGPVKLEKEVMQ